MTKRITGRRLSLVSALLAVTILLFDVATPLGVAGGVPYVAFILLSMWSQKRSFVLFYAVAATILIFLGYFVSPQGSTSWVVLINRFFALFAVWVTACSCVYFRNSARLEEHERTQAILSTAVDPIITIDKYGIVESVNVSCERIFQYSSSELIGQNVSMLMPEPYSSSHNQYLANYLDTGEKKIIGIGREAKAKKKDGTVFPIDLSVSEVKLRTQHLFTGIIRDLTKQKEAEEKATGLGNILENSLNEVYIFRADSLKFIHINHGARENLGYSIDEVGYLTPVDLKPKYSLDQFENMIQPLRTGEQELIEFTTIHQRKDGSTYPVEVHLQLSTFSGVKAFIAIILDITERKQAEKAIVAAAEVTQKSIGQELHDVVCQELTGITILTKVLEKSSGRNNKEFQSKVANIQNIAQSALHNIKNISQGLYPVVLEKCGLNKALDELATKQQKMYGILCTHNGKHFEEGLSAGTELQLYRIAQEAVNNANRHSKAGHISIGLEKAGNHVALFVEDDGIGMSKQEGSEEGMGLFTMRYRANLIGATLDIVPNKQGGTTVSCTL